MAESMSSPWIRDYLTDVAEKYGAQLYNAPASSGKKKVQLTDFLTYQDNSYIWAWISDKDHRVSVRISKDAVGAYKSQYNRNVVDCRFSVLVISNYRPMFAPRPLGPNAPGNTPVSHISLEISHIKLVGIGGHLFGSPRDLELDSKMKEWAQGLRQDGGGGNVLMLRKQQELAQDKKADPSLPSPPPFSLYAPVPPSPATKAPEHVAKSESERPQDFKRAYAKRWRIFDLDPWKLTTKPEEPPNLYPTPHRTPSPTPRLQQQGTPTDWSPSNRGSPITPDKATAAGLEDEVEVLPTTPHRLSSTEEQAMIDTVITSDTRSPQSPAPVQRIKRSLPPRPTSPSRSSPDVFARSSDPPSSQQLPCSSPPRPTSSLPPLSPSSPNPVGLRKNIERKVPHPELPIARPDPAKRGPVQILVPNSDTSGAGSSQSYSQLSRSQQSQCQLSHPPTFPSSLATDFQPLHASTPREGQPGSPTNSTSKIFADSLPTHRDADKHETTSTDVECGTGRLAVNVEKPEELSSTRLPATSTPKIEVLEVGTSDTDEEADQMQLTRSTTRMEAGPDAQSGTQDTNEGNDVEVPSVPQGSPPSADSITRQSSDEPRYVSRSPECQNSTHSLFSDSLEDERIAPINRKGDGIQEANLTHVLSHDPEAWKEPSFLARKNAKGKTRAVEGPVTTDTPSGMAGRKRRGSSRPESPVQKHVQAIEPEEGRAGSGMANTTGNMQLQDIEASASGKIHSSSSNRTLSSPTDTIETTTPSSTSRSSKPRLANFVVDFERIDLGKRVPIPMTDVNKDMKNILLRTGRIRTLGNEVLEDGSVYIKT